MPADTDAVLPPTCSPRTQNSGRKYDFSVPRISGTVLRRVFPERRKVNVSVTWSMPESFQGWGSSASGQCPAQARPSFAPSRPGNATDDSGSLPVLDFCPAGFVHHPDFAGDAAEVELYGLLLIVLASVHELAPIWCSVDLRCEWDRKTWPASQASDSS
jgi:hypothetical protein